MSIILDYFETAKRQHLAAFVGVLLPLLALPARADSTSIRYAVLGISTDNVYQFLAQDKGIYQKYGIDLHIVNFLRGGPEVIAAAASQQIDLGEIGTPILTGISRGIAIKVVGAPPMKRQEFVLVGRPDIADIGALAGQTVGVASVGGGQAQALRFILKAKNIPQAQVKTIAYGSAANGYIALKSSKLAGVVISEPEASKSELDGTGKLLANAVDYYGRYQHSYVFASETFINTHPDAIKVFFKANHEAIDYALGHKDELVAYAEAKLNIDPPVATKIFDELLPRWDDSQAVDVDGLLNAVNIVKDLGDIDKAYQPVVDKITDLRFIDQQERNIQDEQH